MQALLHERIEAGREICTLVDLSRMKVRAKVLESEIGKNEAGPPGRPAVQRLSPERFFTERWNRSGRSSTPWTKRARFLLLPADAGGEIKPGMHAEVESRPRSTPIASLFPRDAILMTGRPEAGLHRGKRGRQVALRRNRGGKRAFCRNPPGDRFDFGHFRRRHGDCRGPFHAGPRLESRRPLTASFGAKGYPMTRFAISSSANQLP